MGAQWENRRRRVLTYTFGEGVGVQAVEAALPTDVVALVNALALATAVWSTQGTKAACLSGSTFEALPRLRFCHPLPVCTSVLHVIRAALQTGFPMIQPFYCGRAHSNYIASQPRMCAEVIQTKQQQRIRTIYSLSSVILARLVVVTCRAETRLKQNKEGNAVGVLRTRRRGDRWTW